MQITVELGKVLALEARGAFASFTGDRRGRNQLRKMSNFNTRGF